MSSVLLTRSYDENQKLKKELEPSGFKCIDCPLLEYNDLSIDYKSILWDYSNIIITSKYAAKKIYVAMNKLNKNNIDYGIINFWVVGKESATILDSLDNILIKYVAHNVKNLIGNIPESIYRDMIYLSADQITMQLPKQIVRLIIYQVSYRSSLNQELIEMIGAVDYILLYSKNCANTLITLLDKYHLINQLKNTIVITISHKVASVIQPYFKVYYTNSSQQQQMINLLICDEKRNKTERTAN